MGNQGEQFAELDTEGKLQIGSAKEALSFAMEKGNLIAAGEYNNKSLVGLTCHTKLLIFLLGRQ